MVLFLDFDGVLHPDQAYLVKGRPVLRAEGALFMWAPLLVDALKNYPGVSGFLCSRRLVDLLSTDFSHFFRPLPGRRRRPWLSHVFMVLPPA